jgi:hypothetical protein
VGYHDDGGATEGVELSRFLEGSNSVAAVPKEEADDKRAEREKKHVG